MSGCEGVGFPVLWRRPDAAASIRRGDVVSWKQPDGSDRMAGTVRAVTAQGYEVRGRFGLYTVAASDITKECG